MNLKEKLRGVISLEKSGRTEEVISLYEKAELFEVAGMFAEKAGEIERAISLYERAGDFGLSCELQHGRMNPGFVKKIEDGGLNFVLKELKENKERARTGYYDGELEWGHEQWEREAERLKRGIIRLEVVVEYEMEKIEKSKENLRELKKENYQMTEAKIEPLKKNEPNQSREDKKRLKPTGCSKQDRAIAILEEEFGKLPKIPEGEDNIFTKKAAWDAWDNYLRRQRKEGILSQCWIEYLDNIERGAHEPRGFPGPEG